MGLAGQPGATGRRGAGPPSCLPAAPGPSTFTFLADTAVTGRATDRARVSPTRSTDRPGRSLRSAPDPDGRAADDRRRDTTAALDHLRRIVRALRLAAGGGESATGLSAAQLFVLQVVHAEPGRSLTEIATRTMTDRTSVAAVVERLVERGLVERRRSASDRRRIEIVSTAAAARTLVRAPHPPTRRVLDGLATLDDRELRRVAQGLAVLVRAMALDADPAAMLFDDGAPTGAAASATRRRAATGPRP